MVWCELARGAAAANLSSRKRLFVCLFFPTAEINARAGRETQKKHVEPRTKQKKKKKSANRKGPGAMCATRRSLQIAARVDSFRGFRSTPNRPRHKQLDSRRSLSSELETKAISNFCFQNLVAKNVYLVAMMRLVFGF